MCKGIKAAPEGGEQRRQREVVRDAGKAIGIVESILRIGQGIVGCEQFAQPHAAEMRQTAGASGMSRPGQTEGIAFGSVAEAFTEQLAAPVAGFGNRHGFSVKGQRRLLNSPDIDPALSHGRA